MTKARPSPGWNKILDGLQDFEGANDELIPTQVTRYTDDDWPYIKHMIIWHKPDLSDLREPYLTWVREAIQKRQAARL